MSKAHIPPAVAIRGHFLKLERKMDKGTDKQYVSDFFYTVQLLISDVCTKFQNSSSSSSGEIFDKNFHMHYLGVRD